MHMLQQLENEPSACGINYQSILVQSWASPKTDQYDHSPQLISIWMYWMLRADNWDCSTSSIKENIFTDNSGELSLKWLLLLKLQTYANLKTQQTLKLVVEFRKQCIFRHMRGMKPWTSCFQTNTTQVTLLCKKLQPLQQKRPTTPNKIHLKNLLRIQLESESTQW